MTATLKDTQDNQIIEKLFIYNAEPKNIDMLITKTIQLIKIKFDIKKFESYLTSTNMSMLAPKRMSDINNKDGSNNNISSQS
jgi:hypothetical protein